MHHHHQRLLIQVLNSDVHNAIMVKFVIPLVSVGETVKTGQPVKMSTSNIQSS